MSIMDQPVEYGISYGRIADKVVPFIHRDLTGDYCGSKIVPIFQDLEEIPAFPVDEFRQSPIIDDEYGIFGNARQQLAVSAIGPGNVQLLEQPGKPLVISTQTGSAGADTQGA